MSNVIKFPDKPPAPDPWRHAQPTLRSIGDREELWIHPFFGISHLIWATGSPHAPEPPTTTGGTPAANRTTHYEQRQYRRAA